MPGADRDVRNDPEALLDLARDSLADSRLLARRQRRNASVLLELALRQALSAVSVAQGLDAPDSLALDSLLRRVPTDHAASALAGRLADPRARDATGVEQLIEALSAADACETEPRPEAGVAAGAGAAQPPGAERGRAGRTPTRPAAPVVAGGRDAARKKTGRHAGGAAATAEVLADGPTALETARSQDRRDGVAHAGDAREAASTAFWRLMDRWRIPDLDALGLLGRERRLTGRGTRPRFTLRGEEATRYGMLCRIDMALGMQGEAPEWLRRPRREAPFGGQAPLALLLHDPVGAAERIMVALNRTGLRAALGRSSQGRDDAG